MTIHPRHKLEWIVQTMIHPAMWLIVLMVILAAPVFWVLRFFEGDDVS